MKTRFLRRAGALLLALALACSLLTLPAAAVDGTDIFQTPSTVSVTTGNTETVDFNLRAHNFFWDEQKIEWVFDSSKISVNNNTNSNCPSASVTGVSPGTTTLTLKVTIEVEDTNLGLAVGDVLTVSCTVIVSAQATGIRLSMTSVNMVVGESTTLSARVTPSTASQAVSWSSSRPGIVEAATDTGTLTAIAEGDAVITATVPGSGLTATCNVHVSAATVTSLRLDKKTATMSPGGDKLTLTATLTPNKVPDRDVVWDIQPKSNMVTLPPGNGTTKVISINSATPIGTTFTIYAYAKANPSVAYDMCVVTVVSPPAPSVNRVEITDPISDAFRYVDPKGTLTLHAVAYPLDATDTDRRLTWESSDTNVATVDQDGNVTGKSPGVTTITARSKNGEYDTREIEVSGLLLSYRKTSSSGGQGTTEKLTESSIVEIAQYRDITVTPTVYGNARLKTILWQSSNNTVVQVVNGRVTANFPGENAVITATVAGTGYEASFKVKVFEDVAQAITVNMGSDPTYSFSGVLSELNNRSQSKAGAPLESVYNLKVSTKNGVLYYGYTAPNTPGHGVGGTERYYYQAGQGQRALRDVTFVPHPGFDGTAVVDYNAASTNGTTFTGTIRIEATTTGDVSYSTAMDEPVSFAAEHFSAVCKTRNGQAVNYVTFNQPASSQGTLYYNYSPSGYFSPKVDSATRYYASSNPSIDQITFVPAPGFVGDSNITYRCTDSSGATYSGLVTVTVFSPDGAKNGNVEYSTAVNQRRALNAADFNDASQRATNGTLNYIRFDSLPATNVGRLYLNYSSSTSSGTQVTTGRSYYRNATPRISNITFVPATGYSGTVTIPFTGTNTSGTNFTGSLIIRVGTGLGTVRYTVAQNQAVRFNASDFNNACRSATGDTLNYLRFTSLPSSSYGTLYYQYNAGSRTGTSVSTSTSYYYSGNNRLLNDVTFAAGSTARSLSFGYTGYNNRGESFSGTVEIQITGDAAPSTGTITGNGLRYTGSSAPIALRTVDFQSACQTSLGTTLASVQFTSLPSVGHLYQNYSGPAQTGSAVSTITRYGAQDLGQISYLPKAEYQGSVYIPFTAYDTQGASFSGNVEIFLSTSYCAATFSDVYGMDWAKPSIEFLRQSGITNGYSNNTFRPRQAISRGEFTLMICRAFRFPTSGSSGFPDVPANSVYAGAVATARNLGIVQGNNGLFQPDRPISRQSAMTMICRAMEAAGQSVPSAPASLLSSYGDGWAVSSFARSSLAALIQMGVVRGTSSMRLNPTDPISRAEMAVILHRVLTR